MDVHMKDIWHDFRIVKLFFGIQKFESESKRLIHTFMMFSYILISILNQALYVYTFINSTSASEKIQCSTFLSMFVLQYFLAPVIITKIDTYERILNYCEGLNFKYPEFFKNCKNLSEKIFRGFVFGLAVIVFVALSIQTVIISILKNELRSPLFVQTPYDHKWTMPFIIFIQITNAFVSDIVIGTVISVILIMMNHFLRLFDIMKVSIKELALETTENKRFDGIKKLVNLHSDLITAQKLLIDFSFFPTIIVEFMTYCLFFVIWFCIFFFPETAFNATAASGMLSIHIGFCYFNEKLADAYDDLKNEMFGLEWYEMSPKERKSLNQIMMALNQPRLLRTGPFHILNFKELSVMLKRVYQCGVVINKFMSFN